MWRLDQEGKLLKADTCPLKRETPASGKKKVLEDTEWYYRTKAPLKVLIYPTLVYPHPNLMSDYVVRLVDLKRMLIDVWALQTE